MYRAVGTSWGSHPVVVVSSLLKQQLPGIILLIIIGLLARAFSFVSPVGSVLIPAIIIGVLISNLYVVPEWAEDGVASHKLLLEAGIVLMGSRVAFEALFRAGPRIILIVLTIIPLTLLIIEVLARLVFDIEEKVGSLLAAGAGICGVSAVVAVAGTIGVKKEYTTYAVATILFFDIVTLFIFPILGRLMDLSGVVFGVWAGVSMFSTGPAAAAGFAYSDVAGRWATMTKLTRNIFLSVAVLFYSMVYARTETATRDSFGFGLLWNSFPKFIFGFIGIILLSNSGILSASQIASLEHAYQWLFLFAFAGLGLELNVRKIRETGIRPILLVCAALAVSSTASLLIIQFLL